jgi:hypothetical protein
MDYVDIAVNVFERCLRTVDLYKMISDEIPTEMYTSVCNILSEEYGKPVTELDPIMLFTILNYVRMTAILVETLSYASDVSLHETIDTVLSIDTERGQY